MENNPHPWIVDKPLLDETQNVDRITCLPDAIISHILSFLPTKDAVATSLLSTTWEQSFPLNFLLIPNLKLDFDDNYVSKYQFPNFVYKVLRLISRHATRIHAFRLCCKNRYGTDLIEYWTRAAKWLKVESFDFSCNIFIRWLFTLHFNGWESLKTLRVCHLVIIPVRYFCLPNLKLLILEHMKIMSPFHPFTKLLSACPVLEELIIVDCEMHIRALDICSPTLKRLRISMHGRYYYGDKNYVEFVLNTPALEELYLCDSHNTAMYTVNELENLRIAHINVKPNYKEKKEQEYLDIVINVVDLVMGCSNAKCLHLSAHTMEAIYSSGRELTSFRNLKHLDLEVCSCSQGLLLHILDCAPNLFSLGIEMGCGIKFKVCDQECEPGLVLQPVPDCFSRHLWEISITAFTGGKQEFKLLEYFVKHAKYLVKMVINIDSEIKREGQLSISNKLIKLPLWSNKCQVRSVCGKKSDLNLAAVHIP